MNPKKWHNLRIKVMSVISVIVAIVSATALDDPSWIPKITMLISTIYLFLVCVANSEE